MLENWLMGKEKNWRCKCGPLWSAATLQSWKDPAEDKDVPKPHTGLCVLGTASVINTLYTAKPEPLSKVQIKYGYDRGDMQIKWMWASFIAERTRSWCRGWSGGVFILWLLGLRENLLQWGPGNSWTWGQNYKSSVLDPVWSSLPWRCPSVSEAGRLCRRSAMSK